MPGQGRLGDKASVPLDAHGCPACPHAGIGPAIHGSPDVNVNGLPALRVDDPGIQAACCGTNTWTATTGSATVFINGKSAHRVGDQTRHCGGMGQLVEGSPNVIVGESGGASGGGGRGDGGELAGSNGLNGRGSSSTRPSPGPHAPLSLPPHASRIQAGPAGHDDAQALHFVEVRIVDAEGKPVIGLIVHLTRGDDGSVKLAHTDAEGVARWEHLPAGEHKVDLDQDDWMLELS